MPEASKKCAYAHLMMAAMRLCQRVPPISKTNIREFPHEWFVVYHNLTESG